MLEITDLSYQIHKKMLLYPISHHFIPGRLYGILGPNGSGKSTFLKTMAAIWKPTQGSVWWQGQALHKKSRLEISRIVTFVPQSPRSQFDFLALDLVEMGSYARKTEASKSIAKQCLETTGCAHLANRRLSTLSGGELQRVYLARALATQCPVLLLDEPTSHLDIRHQLEIWDLLQTLVQKDRIIIASQHDLSLAQRYCHQAIILAKGQVQAAGVPKEILSSQILAHVFGVQHTSQGFTIYSKENYSSPETPLANNNDRAGRLSHAPS